MKNTENEGGRVDWRKRRKAVRERWREGGGSAGEEGRRCILTFTTVILAMLPLFTSNGAVPLGRKI